MSDIKYDTLGVEDLKTTVNVLKEQQEDVFNQRQAKLAQIAAIQKEADALYAEEKRLYQKQVRVKEILQSVQYNCELLAEVLS